MSTQTYVENQPNDLNYVTELAQRMADYIALFEEAAYKIEQHEVLSGKRLEASEAYFNSRVQEIKKATAELQEVMTQAGAARWRVAAENAVNQGKAHVEELQKVTMTFEQLVQQNCQKIQHAADLSSKRMQEVMENLRADEFRVAVQENVQSLEEATDKAVTKVNGTLRWSSLQKFGLVLSVAVIVSFLTALFINDELPWESHATAVAERSAGRTLLKAWPELSMQEQNDVRHDAASQLA